MGSSNDQDADAATQRRRCGVRCPLFTPQEARDPRFSYQGPPVLQPVEAAGGLFRVMEPFIPLLPPAVARQIPLCVPADPPDQEAFYNGASVPLVAWWFLRPMEPRVVAGSLVHDMLYDTQGILEDQDGRRIVVSRHFSDLVFLVVMFGSHYEPWRAWVTWLAVRTFSRHLFQRGQSLPAPCPVGQKAEQHLDHEAWSILVRRAHAPSFLRMTGVLIIMLGLGTSAATWAIRHADELPFLVSIPMTVAGLVTAAIAATVPLASLWWSLQLYRRVRKPRPDA